MFKELDRLALRPTPSLLLLFLLPLLPNFGFSPALCLCLSSASSPLNLHVNLYAFYAPFFRFSLAARVAACEAYVHFYGLQRSPDCGTQDGRVVGFGRFGLKDGQTEGFYDFVMKFVRCKFDVASGCFSYIPSPPHRHPPSTACYRGHIRISSLAFLARAPNAVPLWSPPGLLSWYSVLGARCSVPGAACV